MTNIPVEVALQVRAEHAEGPLWDAASARLWWVDITRERVHCLDPASGADASWPTLGQPGGVLIDVAGEPIVARPDGLARLNHRDGSFELCVPVERDMPENRANDAKVDTRGRVWVGTMALDKRRGHGALYRVEHGVATRVVADVTISNGPAIDEGAGILYLADTAIGVVYAFDLDPDTGRLGNRRRFLTFPEGEVWPDGMTIDDEGMLWVALGRASAVHRYDRQATLREVIAIPTSNPTSVAFGGADGGDLYITTSWFDLKPHERTVQPWAGSIVRCRPGVTGRPSPRVPYSALRTEARAVPHAPC